MSKFLTNVWHGKMTVYVFNRELARPCSFLRNADHNCYICRCWITNKTQCRPLLMTTSWPRPLWVSELDNILLLVYSKVHRSTELLGVFSLLCFWHVGKNYLFNFVSWNIIHKKTLVTLSFIFYWAKITTNVAPTLHKGKFYICLTFNSRSGLIHYNFHISII